MSSFPSGGGGAFGIDLDAIVKSSSSSSPATSTRSTHFCSSSSPSSTLSESSSYPLAISTKRARAPRKRPNQGYEEAAALLAAAYPNVFSAKCLPKLCKKKNTRPFYSEPHAELLPRFPALGKAGFLLLEYVPHEQGLLLEPARPMSSSGRSSACLSPASTEFPDPNSPAGIGDGFDADSILDGELGEGIDNILGNLDVNSNSSSSNEVSPYLWKRTVYGYAGCGVDMRQALRRGTEEGEWRRSRTVEVLQIAPEFNPAPPHPPSTNRKKKKEKQKVQKVEKVEKAEKDELKLGLAASSSPTQQQRAAANSKACLGLKLDYEEVLKAWSGRGSPFSDAGVSSESPVDTIQAKLSWIDLFPDEAAAAAAAESGEVKEASVMRYKEKRRSRLFSGRIRYLVRKVSPDQRPRTKACVRATSSCPSLSHDHP